MEQFNSNNYKKRNAVQDFTHSCLGKIIILFAILCVMFVIALFTRPTDSMMQWQTEDNIRECLEASDSIQSDAIDDYVGNLGRVFTHADSAKFNKEMWNIFNKYNRIEIYSHTTFKTAYIHNNTHPQGVRVGIGIFGIVFPTIKYSDMLLNTGVMRREYRRGLIREVTVPDNYIGDNPNVQPFHYKGDPDN